jgi:hypothetical protein
MATQQLNIRISEEEAAHLETLASRTAGILTKQAVARLLIQHSIATGWDPLDRSCTLVKASPAPQEEGEAFASTSTSISSSSLLDTKKEKNKKGLNSRKRTEATPEFEAFWSAYQAAPSNRKVPSQSKAKSWEEWQKAIKQETPERLLQAAEGAVRDAVACEWDYKLPDCFRWLRDGRYSVLLETHAPAQAKPSWML